MNVKVEKWKRTYDISYDKYCVIHTLQEESGNVIRKLAYDGARKQGKGINESVSYSYYILNRVHSIFQNEVSKAYNKYYDDLRDSHRANNLGLYTKPKED